VVADACLVVGFALACVGVYLTLGLGPACLASGVVLFVAGGLQARRR
jgi:hypothetical protein